MKKKMLCTVIALFGLSLANQTQAETKPIRALYLTGGCCHKYKDQKDIIAKGLAARAKVLKFDVKFAKNEKEYISFYDGDWAKGYNVVIHNECWAGFKDTTKIDSIVKQHVDAKVGVIMIHCAMHTFRGTKTKEWDKLVGVVSSRHGAKFRIEVVTVKPDHPVMKGVPKDWKTKNGELYSTKLMPNATALAEGRKVRGDPKGKNVCLWANVHKEMRPFGCTLGHHNETMLDPVWMDMFARGRLWACKKIADDGTPLPGYGPTK